MYARFEREALDEGFDRMAALFRMVGNIERMHDERYGAFIAQLEKDLLYRKAQPSAGSARSAGACTRARSRPSSARSAAIRRGHFKPAEKITDV